MHEHCIYTVKLSIIQYIPVYTRIRYAMMGQDSSCTMWLRLGDSDKLWVQPKCPGPGAAHTICREYVPRPGPARRAGPVGKIL